MICDALEQLAPAPSNTALTGSGVHSYRELKHFVADRPGHDRRYAVDASKIRRELGWAPKRTFLDGLTDTVRWYLQHRDALQAAKLGYDRERLGLGTAAR
jgi:dTDP-glucose 4,6-dehydratase